MPKHITKRSVFMGGGLIAAGSPIEKSLIPDVFLKHFEGFDDDGKPVKVIKVSDEDLAKAKLAEECFLLYQVILDIKKPLADLKKDSDAAKDEFVKAVTQDAKKKLEAQCLKDYKVNLDMRKSLAEMQKDCDKAKASFEKELAAVKAKAKTPAAK